jgi:hypothetical protein
VGTRIRRQPAPSRGIHAGREPSGEQDERHHDQADQSAYYHAEDKGKLVFALPQSFQAPAEPGNPGWSLVAIHRPADVLRCPNPEFHYRARRGLEPYRLTEDTCGHENRRLKRQRIRVAAGSRLKSVAHTLGDRNLPESGKKGWPPEIAVPPKRGPETVLHRYSLDESKVLPQTDRVTQARGKLAYIVPPSHFRSQPLLGRKRNPVRTGYWVGQVLKYTRSVIGVRDGLRACAAA